MPFLFALFMTVLIIMGLTEVSIPLLWIYYVFSLLLF